MMIPLDDENDKNEKINGGGENDCASNDQERVRL
jgi:hypothetical protein